MISIPSLKQVCINSINKQIGVKFHQIPYDNTSELRLVAKKCFECFCAFQSQEANSSLFVQTFSTLFGDITEALAPPTLLAIQKNVNWVAQVLDFADPDSYSPSLTKLNKAVVARLYHAVMQILLLNGSSVHDYVFFPHQRDFLLQEQRKGLAILNIAPIRAPFFAFEFFIHLELEYFQLLHLRDYNFSVMEDRRALSALFQTNSQLFFKYREVLSQHPIAVAEALKLGQLNFESIEKVFWDIKEIALAAVQRDGMVLSSLAKELRADRNVVLAAVKNTGDALRYAAPNCRSDREIVFLATESRAEALSYADASLCADFQFILSIVSCRGMALEFASASLKDNYQIVLKAVGNHGYSLQFASERLRANTNIVLLAAKLQGGALRFAALRLRSDRQIIMAAVSSWAEALQFADPEICKNLDVVTQAVNTHGSALTYADETLRGNRQLVLKAVQTAGRVLEYVNAYLRDDKEVVLKALEDCVDSLEFASPRLRDDQEIIFKAMDQDAATALHFASDRLRNDPDVISRADRLIYVQERLWDLFVMHMPGRIWQFGI